MELILTGHFSFFGPGILFFFTKFKKFGDDSIVQSASKDSQSTYERDTISRLHYCINATGRVSLYNMTLAVNSV